MEIYNKSKHLIKSRLFLGGVGSDYGFPFATNQTYFFCSNKIYAGFNVFA